MNRRLNSISAPILPAQLPTAAYPCSGYTVERRTHADLRAGQQLVQIVNARNGLPVEFHNQVAFAQIRRDWPGCPARRG